MDEMKYYFLKEGEKSGPYELNQLVNQGVDAYSKVWRKGLNDWVLAGSLPDLHFLVDETPPPIDNKEDSYQDTVESWLNSEAIKDTEVAKSRQRKTWSFIVGREGRKKYFLITLVYFTFILIIRILELVLEKDASAFYRISLPLWVIWLRSLAKRCHDVNLSGWYGFIPFMAIVLIFLPGTKGPNRFGERNSSRK